MTNAESENPSRLPANPPHWSLLPGDRVECAGSHGTVEVLMEHDMVLLKLDGESHSVPSGSCVLLGRVEPGLMEEVQELVNTLVSAGQDSKRLLSRQASTLLADTRGALTRAEKLQAAAMLIVSAGLLSLHDAERDDG